MKIKNLTIVFAVFISVVSLISSVFAVYNPNDSRPDMNIDDSLPEDIKKAQDLRKLDLAKNNLKLNDIKNDVKNLDITNAQIKTFAQAKEKIINSCVKALESSEELDNAQEVCTKIIENRKDCANILNDANIEGTEDKCQKMFQAIGHVIQNNIRERVVAGFAKENQEKFETLSAEQKEKFSKLPRGQQVRILAQDKDFQNNLDKIKLEKVDKEKLLQKREITQSKKEEFKNKFEMVKEKFKENQDKYKEKKQEFLQIKEKLKDCQNNTGSEECLKLEEDAIGIAKTHMRNGLNVAVNQLEGLILKIEENDDLEQERADEMILNIKNQIDKLNSLLDEVENAQTKGDVNSVAKEVANEWSKMKNHARLNSFNVLLSKNEELINRANLVADKIDCGLDQMYNEDKNTSDIELKVAQHNEKIGEALENHELVKSMIEELNASVNEEDSELDVKETKDKIGEYLRQTQKSLRDGHVILQGIYKEFRTQNIDIKECSDEYYQVIEE